jgi:hypothetical protein
MIDVQGTVPVLNRVRIGSSYLFVPSHLLKAISLPKKIVVSSREGGTAKK